MKLTNASCLILLLALIHTADAGVMTAGVEDDFAGGTEPASPNPFLVAASPNVRFFGDFDQTAGLNGGSSESPISHMFTFQPGIVSGTLELSVLAGQNGGTVTDAILLSFADGNGSNFVWQRSLGARGSDPGLFGGSWTAGRKGSLVLDLSALPMIDGSTLDIISQMNTRGFLDVTVADETAVDFYRLSLNSVPEPSTVICFCSLMASSLFCRQRRSRLWHA